MPARWYPSSTTVRVRAPAMYRSTIVLSGTEGRSWGRRKVSPSLRRSFCTEACWTPCVAAGRTSDMSSSIARSVSSSLKSSSLLGGAFTGSEYAFWTSFQKSSCGRPSCSYLLHPAFQPRRSEEHTSELQSRPHLVCRLLLEKKKKN